MDNRPTIRFHWQVTLSKREERGDYKIVPPGGGARRAGLQLDEDVDVDGPITPETIQSLKRSQNNEDIERFKGFKKKAKHY